MTGAEDGVIGYRSTGEPIYAGELLAEIKAEEQAEQEYLTLLTRGLPTSDDRIAARLLARMGRMFRG